MLCTLQSPETLPEISDESKKRSEYELSFGKGFGNDNLTNI